MDDPVPLRTHRSISLPFGHGSLDVRVDADLLEAPPAHAISDEPGAIFDALRNPIGRPPLAEIVKPGERVAIVVNDITRLCRTDLMLPPILDTLNGAGVADSDIFIVFALGIHRTQTDEERSQILGPEVHSRIRNFDHISTANDDLTYVGTTSFGNRVEINQRVWEADRIILTGEIVFHLIAGYSGGRKSLVPGVAGFRTTTFNHRMILDPRCRAGALDGNPAHEDLLEGCRLVDPDFILNLVLTPRGELVKVVAGHYDLAHREGCRAVDKMLRVRIAEPYDLLIASAGGFPLDIDLRQAHKGLENACQAVRPGSSVMFYAECLSGAGIASIEEYAFKYADDTEMRRALESNFVVGGHKAFWLARLGRLYDIHLVSRLDPDLVTRCHLKPVSLQAHQTVLNNLIAREGRGARIGVLPYAGFTLPSLGVY